ncbi:MAG: penicillin-binding protein [Solirubrobacteraceae bacterium]|jgi:penicillin-binding protein 1A|nr:penicillin-binding protein [Solirubrobacteraceae bacterium]
MSEDDRRHTYEDAPPDGGASHADSPPKAFGTRGDHPPPTVPHPLDQLPLDPSPAEHPTREIPPGLADGEPAPQENGHGAEESSYAEALAALAHFEVDASWPGGPDRVAVPSADLLETPPVEDLPALDPAAGGDHGAPPGDAPVAHLPGGGDGGRRRKPRLKKLRLLIVLVPLGLLAVVSAVFGMIMAIASDLPALENRAEYKSAKNSILLDINGTQIGVLTGRDNRILVASRDIPFVMKRAIISVEDRRFYSNSGIDLKGIARALVADVFKQRAAQGASTITQQFVKNALRAQNRRTVFEKAREAALAYHLTRKWSKDKILTEYLNSIYFGNGAYGIESAARTYFGHDPSSRQFNCGTTGQPPCVHGLAEHPEEAALLAGVVASPSTFDPVVHQRAAYLRRNLVLKDMYAQGYLTNSQYQVAINTALPARQYIIPPQEKVIEPGVAYFTTWVKQQLVDRYHVPEAFDGGLVVHTTLDLELQRQAEKAINNYLADPSGPSAAMVAIDNASGEVRALVGGRDFNQEPFNLATQGQRQPGSAFKPFVLAQALKEGISPDSVWTSQKKSFVVPHTRGREHFIVNNYEGAYAGSRTLADATRVSDNSVFAEVGIKAGTTAIAKLARAAGIRTPVSTNPAITLGGLHRGVTVLDMAHAYETFAHDGQRVYGTLGAPNDGPVGIHSVTIPGSQPDRNKLILRRVIPSDVDQTEQGILNTVVTSGTGKAAAFGMWAAGKTGTTENYGDAWFVGFTRRMTVAVWVGYPDRLRSMKTEFGGSPVAGGTFPAEIWHDFMVNAETIYAQRAADKAAKTGQTQTTTDTTTTDTTAGPNGPLPSSSATTPSTTPSGAGNGPATPTGTGGPTRAVTPTAPAQGNPAPTQATQAPANPAPTPATPPASAPAPAGAPANPGATGGAGAAGGAQGPPSG